MTHEEEYRYDIRGLINDVKNNGLFVWEAADRIEEIIRQQIKREQEVVVE